MSTQVGIAMLLSFLVWRQVATANYLYFIWIGVAILFVAYQGRFSLAEVQDRLWHHDYFSLFLLVIDLLAHCSVAVFCGVGWLGFGLLVCSYFWFGRVARSLSIRYAKHDILRSITEYQPELREEERTRLARYMLEVRLAKFGVPSRQRDLF